jgi:hypothetical protein
MVLGLCAGRSRLGPICVPGQRSLENFDPTVVGTGLTVDPVCTETSEIKLEATVEPPLQVILETWRNITGQNIYWGYVCEGNGTTVEGNGTTVDGNGAAVEGNFSTHLHNGAITGDWTTVLVDSSQSQSLAVGDRCKFFGCYEYIVNTGEGSLLNPIQLHYVSNFNGTSCVVDKDECSDGTSQCEHECINMMTGTANSYQCTCRKGFSLSDDQHNCIDVDECTAEELNNCDQMCTVTGDGWYNCSCEDGFTLDQDNHTCNDINECATNGTTLCELTGSDCNNTLGSYQCICQEGYEFNELHQLCEDVDECAAEELNNCDQMCTVTGDGWYNCSCEDGFTLDQDGHTCNDIDECTSNGTTFCELTGRDCNNTLGSYHCTCQEGYYFNEPGQLCTERDVCTKNHTCNASSGVWRSFRLCEFS